MFQTLKISLLNPCPESAVKSDSTLNTWVLNHPWVELGNSHVSYRFPAITAEYTGYIQQLICIL
jgi:hypothetical protein